MAGTLIPRKELAPTELGYVALSELGCAMGAYLQISLHCDCFESSQASRQPESGPSSQFQGLPLGMPGVGRGRGCGFVLAAVSYRGTCGI